MAVYLQLFSIHATQPALVMSTYLIIRLCECDVPVAGNMISIVLVETRREALSRHPCFKCRNNITTTIKHDDCFTRGSLVDMAMLGSKI